MRCWRRRGPPSGGCACCRRGPGPASCWRWACFAGLGYRNVWAKLTAALDGLEPPAPSARALRDLRRRLGPAPLKALFGVLAGPVAQPSTPGVMFGRYRTVAFDGCTSVKVPDTARNRGWLGKMRAALGVTGYPAVELMTLAETGTRALIGAVFGPPATGETDYARRLLHLLTPGMLVLADRGFDGAAFLAGVAATRAQFLVRLGSRRRLPVLARLPDESFLSRIGELTVRVIEARVTVTCADGRTWTASYRLATTLAGHRRRDHPRHRPRPRQLHYRPGNREANAHPGRRRRHQRRRPHRPDRRRRPERAARTAPPPGQRPQSQIPVIPLEQSRPPPARPQQHRHQPGRHRQPPRNSTPNPGTPRQMLDRHARTLTPRHWV
jgi:transposase IS4-like protein/DDE family transposase